MLKKKGASWCNRGWVKSANDSTCKETAHPISKEDYQKMQENDPERRGDCGTEGPNRAVWCNPNLMFGANCYGLKPNPRTHEKIKSRTMSDSERRIHNKIAEINQYKDELSILPHNVDSWSQ